MYKRSYLLIIPIICLLQLGYTQERHCLSDVYMEQLENNNEAYLENRKQLELLIKTQNTSAQNRTDFILPIVFHVVYRKEAQRVSENQLRAQLDILNKHFNTAPNLNGILTDFEDRTANPNIRFKLACIDPAGNPTNGITYTQTTAANLGFRQETNGDFSLHYDKYGGKDPWDVNLYINVWIAEFAELVLGRALIPTIELHPNEDGIVISTDFIGTLGDDETTKPYEQGKTLVHEMGHHLGLYHLWGRNERLDCLDDDLVDDTPSQSEIYYGCQDEATSFSCNSKDMVNNFMGYMNDDCLRYFSKGQVQRMQSIIRILRRDLMDSPGIADCTSESNSENIWSDPFRDRLLINDDGNGDTTFDIDIYDMSGRLIKQLRSVDTYLFSYSLNEFQSGIYLIQIKKPGQEAIVKKIFIY